MLNEALELPRDTGHLLVSQQPTADSSKQVDQLYQWQTCFDCMS